MTVMEESTLRRLTLLGGPLIISKELLQHVKDGIPLGVNVVSSNSLRRLCASALPARGQL